MTSFLPNFFLSQFFLSPTFSAVLLFCAGLTCHIGSLYYIIQHSNPVAQCSRAYFRSGVVVFAMTKYSKLGLG